MTTSDLTPLEAGALKALLAGNGPLLAALRLQCVGLRVGKRELTGFGVFVELEVDSSAQAAIVTEPSLQIGGVEAEIAGLHHGAGFVLFVEKGYLSLLEGFSYDEPWPEDTSSFKFHSPQEPSPTEK